VIQTFWRTMAGLFATAVVFSTLSWLYIWRSHIPFTPPTGVFQLFNLPTDFPSIWNVVRPAQTNSALAPFLVLFLQVFLTGGLLGTLLRLNTRQSLGTSSFVADGLRAFGRLLAWNLIWTLLLSFFLIGVLKVFLPLGEVLAFLLLIVRYLFLFAEIALVSETSLRFGQAIRAALSAMKNGLVPMIPFAIVIMVLTGLVLYASTTLPVLWFLFVTLVYVCALTWLSHVVVARYLYYSDLHAPRTTQVDTI